MCIIICVNLPTATCTIACIFSCIVPYINCSLSIYLLCDFMTIKSLLLILSSYQILMKILFHLKLRYYTHMQQICTTSVSFNAHVTCFVDISFFLGEDIILYNYCASNFLVLALCNLGQRDWYCSLVRVSSLVLI